MMNLLFVCSANRLRSPTAENVFSTVPGWDVRSAGTDACCARPLTAEMVAVADWIFAMEKSHREKIRKKFRQRPPDSRIIALNIPDEYERNDPELIALLKTRVGRILGPIPDPEGGPAVSFSSRQIDAMMRHPHRFHTGRVPREVRVESPLYDLISAIPPALHSWFRGIRLSPELGYHGHHEFANGAQLARWLKPHDRMLETDSWPAESWRDKRFRGPVTIETLIRHCVNAEEIRERLAVNSSSTQSFLARMRHLGLAEPEARPKGAGPAP